MPDPHPDTEAAPEASITIEARVDNLAEVRAFVRAHATSAGVEAETTADLVQAVDELVCNVVEHGYARQPGSVEVAFLPSADGLAFRIRDAAPPFDPRTVPEPDLDLPLERRRLGGMGVHLARALTDGFDHRILPSGGNEVTVRKRLRPATEGTDDGHHDRAPTPAASEIVHAVRSDVASFRADAEPSDDLTLLVGRREPATDSAATIGSDPG